MLVTRQIPALWNGVSQQPDPVRLPSQCAEQVNCWSSVIDGVSKRNPSEYLATFPANAVASGYAMHVIDRDVAERYIVVSDGTRLRVFDLAGHERVVNAPLGWGYLSLDPGITPSAGYSMMTVADYTFIVNKTKRVGLLPVGADHDPPTADYWWLNRRPAPTAQLKAIDNESGDGGATGGGTSSGGTGGSSPPPPVSNPTPDPDPDSNPVGTYKGAKQTLQDLPTSGNVIGDVWAIVGGDNTSAFTTYYVMYQSSGGIGGQNVWVECVKPGLQNMLDPLTMPHALIRNGNGTFTFGPFAWAPRHVGDDNSNPHPSFVHRKIRDAFFHMNRLGFCVDENVVMSRAGAFGTFHRLTVVDYLADEVIDIAASETNVAKMEFAVPFQGTMMLFADQTQFQLSHKDILSGGSVSLDVTTRYPMVPGVRPAPAGSDVYFASQGSGFGKLREYFVNNDNITTDAADVSAHAPQYVPYGVHTITASPEFDSVFMLTKGAPNKIFVYKYFWQTETEKAQSAWHHWEFEQNSEVLAAHALGSALYVLVRHRHDSNNIVPPYVTLEKIALFKTKAPFAHHQIHLDRRYLLDRLSGSEGMEMLDADSYPISLPYNVEENIRDKFRVVNPDSGEQYNVLSWDNLATPRVRQKPMRVMCGFVYDSRYTFNKQFMLNAKGEAVLSGRLQLKTMTVYFTETGYFRVEILPYGANTQTMKVREFPAQLGSVIGQGSLGSANIAEGSAKFALAANARECEITLVNDSYLPVTWHSAEWEGMYFNRARA